MRSLLLTALFAASVFAQTSEPAAVRETPALREARHSFMLASTRAEALFQVADSLDSRLRAEGSSLHPATITLRLRIEKSLDKAQAAIDKGDISAANQQMKISGELADRLARRIGGE